MSRNFTFAEGEYYHCYSRGVEKRKIFLDKNDYKRFITLLFVCNSIDKIHLSDHQKKTFQEIFNIPRADSLVDIGVYCLMPNHFHLLLMEKMKGGISLFMQKLMTAYIMYFNKKYNRAGSLFESSYKARRINGNRYLKYLFSYIHLNPIKIINPKWKENKIGNILETKKYLREYSYSSYLDYVQEDRPQKIILNQDVFPNYFNNKEEFEREIFDWLKYDKCQG